MPFIEQQKDINHFLMLYSFNGPIDLLHGDNAIIKFLATFAADWKYCLVFFLSFYLKIHIYPVKSRSL